MANGLQRIGRGLSGFSAGIAGDLPRFQQGLALEQEREQQLSEQRRRAAALDNRRGIGLLEGGFTDRAKTLFNNRALELSNLGAQNTDSTDFVRSLLDQGDTDRALEFLRIADEAAVTGGFIDPRQAPKVLPASAISETGQIATQTPSGDINIRDVPGFKQAERGGLASAVTRIMGNGTTIQALPDGSVQVTGPQGEVLAGQDRLDALAQARQDELDFERTKAGAKAAGTQAIKVAGETFEKLGKIDTAIANFDDAIAALDAGAQTGPIISKLPSFRASSVELDNIQGRLGLDVIGNTTFGALSESELAFALNTALPQRLEPQELRSWLSEKRDVQQKLRNYLEDAAIFLGVEGNTVADWTAAQRELRNRTEQSTSLTPEEQAELEALEAELGRP